MSLIETAIAAEAPARPRPLMAKAWRYGSSTLGPVATSGAHFLASLIFVRSLPAVAFGLFSFVMVVVPFCMSMIGATSVIAVTQSLHEPEERRAAILPTCLKLNLVLSAMAALIVFVLLLGAHAAPGAAALLALFGGFSTERWFARCFAYVQGRLTRALASDLAYGAALIAGLGLLSALHAMTLVSGATVLAGAALIGILPLGRGFLREQIAALSSGRIRDYAPIFRDVTRWSLLGVIFTEVTVNAHAYVVTFLSGSGAFALLALGTLMMRPISLVQGALPDLERPTMTRSMVARDWPGLARIRRDFRAVLLAVWAATSLLAVGLLVWFPALLLKKGYPESQVILVTAIAATIMMVRNFRTPLAVELQAAGEFKALAAIGTKSCAVSLIGTLALLLAFGPIASLGGILAGEAVILWAVWRLTRAWRAAHV